MRSVSIFSQPPQKLFKIRGKFLRGFFNDKYKGEYHSKPRQNYPITYLPNGYIDILKTSHILKKKKSMEIKSFLILQIQHWILIVNKI